MFLIHNPNMTLCPHCQTENKASARFCNECGSPFTPIKAAPSAVTSPLEPVLAVDSAQENSAGAIPHERRRTTAQPPSAQLPTPSLPLASPQATDKAIFAPQDGILEGAPTPSFLIANQLTVPARAPIWPEQPLEPEPFLERKPETKPLRQAESPAHPVTCITPAKANGSLTRYGLQGVGLALVIVVIGGVVLFSRLKAPASAITHASTKPAVKAVEELPHPDLANGKGVATLPERLIIRPRTQASRSATAPTKLSTEVPRATVAAQPAIEPPSSKASTASAKEEPLPALQEGLNCLPQKQYDCAINSARSAGKQNPNNGEAKRLLERAKEACQQALESINIE